jgi:acylphosphatase
MDKGDKQYEIVVHGRVQGVGFRYAARNQARSLGLKGWVENRPDGSVLTLIQGSPETCLSYIQWCRKGPGYSWVEDIDIVEKPASPLSHFKIKS